MKDRVKIKNGFTALPNSLLRSGALSVGAKGMLAIIASHSDDWDFRRDDMMKKSGCKRHSYYKLLNELKDGGYLDIVPRDSVNGRFSGSDWYLDFEPCVEIQHTEPCVEIQHLPSVEIPHAEDQHHKKNNPSKKKKRNMRAEPAPERLRVADADQRTAEMILTGKQYLCATLKTSTVWRLIEDGLVTKEQCTAAGIRL